MYGDDIFLRMNNYNKIIPDTELTFHDKLRMIEIEMYNKKIDTNDKIKYLS